MHGCVFLLPSPPPSTSSLTGAFYAAPLFLRSAAHVPRRYPLLSPLPPTARRPNRVILVKNRSRYHAAISGATRVNNVSDLGRRRRSRKRIEGRREKAKERNIGRRRRRRRRSGRKRRRPPETETGQPLPSLRFAGCSTRFIHEFHFHGHGHGHAIRVATTIAPPPSRCFFSPPASFREKKNKPSETRGTRFQTFPQPT